MSHSTVREQIANRCLHFNGVQNDTCKAGVCYEGFKFVKKLPCLRSLAGDTTCEKRQWLTEEQVNAEAADLERRAAKFMKLMPLIKRIKKEHEGQSWSGVETCPECQGRLHLSIAGCNGHVHGCCETEGCLKWME